MHPRLRSAIMLSALLMAVLAVAGCSGGNGTATAAENDDSAAPAEEVAAGDTATVTATEFAFGPDTFTLLADTATPVVLENKGVVEHDITIEGTDVVIHADATTTAQGDVTLAAGDYVFFCSVPGHREAGMEGTVTVGG